MAILNKVRLGENKHEIYIKNPCKYIRNLKKKLKSCKAQWKIDQEYI